MILKNHFFCWIAPQDHWFKEDCPINGPYKLLGRPRPYAFKHYLKLGQNITAFQKIIEEIDPDKDMPSNLDSPESGLDALVQAILCPEIVEWKENTSKIIIFVTDAEQHYALDGVLLGLMENFHSSNQCKTNIADGFYTDEEKFDYPSFGQVRLFFSNKETCGAQ